MKWRSFLVAAFLAVGCDSNKISDQVLEFSDRSWKISQPAEFEFIISDSTTLYDLSCTLRNSLDYPYARLFINYTLTDSVGQKLSGKMISEYLFDQKTGEPHGQSGLGDLYDHRFTLLKGYKFNHSGKFKVTMGQVMRQDTLKGVLAVGLLIEKTDNSSK